MNEWKEVILEEVTTRIGDGLHGTPKYDSKGEYFFINGNNLKDGKIFIKSDTKKVTKEVAIKHEKPLSEKTILLAINGTIGNLAYYNFEKCMLGKSACYINVSDEIDVRYMYYNFLNEDFQFYLEMIATGTTIPNVPLKGIKKYTFKLPPLPEQKAIAEVLTSLDDKIDLLHCQNKTLEQMAETLFRQWFVVEAKEDWEWHQIGDFVEVMRGLSYKGAGLSDKENGIPMHNLNSVFEGGGYKYEGIKYYSGDYKERHHVKSGDVIITNTEQGHDMLLIGFPAIVPKYYGDNGIFSQHIYKLRLKDETLTESFLYYLLMTYDVREQISGATNGSTVNMLAKDGIEWAKFRKPPQQKIIEFTNIAKPLLEKAETNYCQIKNLEKMRDTLLPKLMSGEVRVDTQG